LFRSPGIPVVGLLRRLQVGPCLVAMPRGGPDRPLMIRRGPEALYAELSMEC
jgi:hypothetical protein